MTALAFFVGLGCGVVWTVLYQLRRDEKVFRLRRQEYLARGERCRVSAERALAVRAARARLDHPNPWKTQPGYWFLEDLGNLFDEDEPETWGV